MKSTSHFRVAMSAAMLAWMVTASVHAASVEHYLDEAKKYQQKGEYRAAIIQLKNALQKDADRPQVRILLAESYIKVGDGAAAEKELKRARGLGAADAQVLPLLGRAYMLQHKFKAMLAELEPSQDAPPKLRASLLALQGEAYLGLGDGARAQERFSAALKLDEGAQEAWLGQARASLMQKDADGAAKQVDELVTRFPRSADTWVLKGELHRMRGEYAPGAEAFQKAITIEPENVNAQLGEAMMLIAQKKYDQGGKHLEIVLKLVPRHPVANYLKGLAAFQQGKNQPAEDALQQALAVAPNYAPARLLMGAIHYSRNELEQAAASLKEFLSAIPDHLPARKLYAATQLKLKQPDRAIETLDVVLKQHADDPQLLSLMGSAYMQKGEFTKGVGYLEKAVAVAPDASALRTQLALGYIASGESGQAVSQLESAVDLGGVSQADILLVLTHLQRNEFDDALKTAEALAKKMPDNPVPLNLMGAAYLGKKDTAAARKQFEQALQTDPAFASAHINLAKLDLAAGDAAAAKRHYQAILAKDDKHVGAMMGLAQLADLAHDDQKVLHWLQQAHSKAPEALEPGVLLARYYLQHGHALKALSVTQDLTRRHPDHPLALETAGEAQLANKQTSNALATFRKLIDRQPKSAHAYYLLASAQVQDQDFKGAEASINKALKLQPDFPEGMVMLAAIKERNGEQKAAVEVAHRLQKQHPKAPLGYEVEGDIYAKGDKSAEAAKAYDKAYRMGPSAGLAVKLYRARLDQGQANATEPLEQWLESHPDDMAITMALAGAYQAADRKKGAITLYERILQKLPQNAVALNNLAWLYQETGDDRAVEVAERAYKLKPEEPAIVDTLGWLLIQNGNSTRGLTLLQEAAMRAPHLAEIRYHMAVGLEKAGRKDEARKELERLLRDDKDFAQAGEARALLKRLQAN